MGDGAPPRGPVEITGVETVATAVTAGLKYDDAADWRKFEAGGGWLKEGTLETGTRGLTSRKRRETVRGRTLEDEGGAIDADETGRREGPKKLEVMVAEVEDGSWLVA